MGGISSSKTLTNLIRNNQWSSFTNNKQQTQTSICSSAIINPNHSCLVDTVTCNNVDDILGALPLLRHFLRPSKTRHHDHDSWILKVRSLRLILQSVSFQGRQTCEHTRTHWENYSRFKIIWSSNESQEFLQQYSCPLCSTFSLRVHQQLKMLLSLFLAVLIYCEFWDFSRLAKLYRVHRSCAMSRKVLPLHQNISAFMFPLFFSSASKVKIKKRPELKKSVVKLNWWYKS